MKRTFEVLFYVTFAAGMAFGTSSFTLMSALFEVATTPWVIAAILGSALFSMFISASVAELASMYPSSPGVRTYLKAALPNGLSLMLVYLYLGFMVLVAGVESYMFALVSTSVFPQFQPLSVVLGLLAFTIIVNLIGFELPKTLQIIMTIALLAIAIVAALYGVIAGDHSRFFQNATLKEGLALPGMIGLGVYLYVGYEWTTMLGFRPSSYRRTIPLSMPLAIASNAITYSVFAAGLVAIVSPALMKGNPIPQVRYCLEIAGPTGVYIALALSLTAIFTTFNAGILGGSRLIYILTREGNLPGWCAKMSLTTSAPVGGIAVLGVLATISSVLVVTFELEILAAVIGSCIVSFVYGAFLYAALKLRRTDPQRERPFRNPVPAWLQWVMMVLVPAMGIGALFSEPKWRLQAILGLIIMVIIAAGVTAASLARKERGLPLLQRQRAAAE